MKLCPVCKMQASDEAANCKTCGEALAVPEHLADPRSGKRSGSQPWFMIAVVVAGCLWFGYRHWQGLQTGGDTALSAECRKKCEVNCKQMFVTDSCAAGSERLEKCVLDCRNNVGPVLAAGVE